jgi:hypothetical protein
VAGITEIEHRIGFPNLVAVPAPPVIYKAIGAHLRVGADFGFKLQGGFAMTHSPNKDTNGK